MTVQEAARMLGVSKGMVYGLAAPAGPIPCARIGSRIIFDQVDIVEFKQKCRYTEVKHAVGISLIFDRYVSGRRVRATKTLPKTWNQAQADAFDRREFS